MAGVMGRGRKRKCLTCREPFAPNTKHHRYCSHRCFKNGPKQKKWRARHFKDKYNNDPEFRKKHLERSRASHMREGERLICRSVYFAQEDKDSLFHNAKFIKELTGVTCPMVEKEAGG